MSRSRKLHSHTKSGKFPVDANYTLDTLGFIQSVDHQTNMVSIQVTDKHGTQVNHGWTIYSADYLEYVLDEITKNFSESEREKLLQFLDAHAIYTRLPKFDPVEEHVICYDHSSRIVFIR